MSLHMWGRPRAEPQNHLLVGSRSDKCHALLQLLLSFPDLSLEISRSKQDEPLPIKVYRIALFNASIAFESRIVEVHQLRYVLVEQVSTDIVIVVSNVKSRGVRLSRISLIPS